MFYIAVEHIQTGLETRRKNRCPIDCGTLVILPYLDTASSRAGTPAELKHIIKRRKRN